MERASGSPLPGQFRSRPGEVFPLYHVLADVGEFAGGDVISTQASDPLRADALLLRAGRRRRLVVANMSPDLQHVRIRLNTGGAIRSTMLDRHSAAVAMHDPEAFRKAGASTSEVPSGGVLPVSLLPYAICRFDFSA
jgi:D-apionolactonase